MRTAGVDFWYFLNEGSWARITQKHSKTINMVFVYCYFCWMCDGALYIKMENMKLICWHLIAEIIYGGGPQIR